MTERHLGKAPKVEDPRTLRLAKYLDTQTIKPPKSVDYLSKVSRWPGYLNDEIGDCTIAAQGHMIESWTTYGMGREVSVSNADVLTTYAAVSGYIPGDPSTDNGADLLSCLNYWRHTGIGGHKIVAFAEVDIHNTVEVKAAIDLFGGLYAGLQLPISAQDQPVWRPAHGPNGAPGSWGGHCVPYGSYNGVSLHCVTWGAVQHLTWAFLREYGDEAYAVVTQDWLDLTGHDPHGLDLQGLLTDLAAVTGGSSQPAVPEHQPLRGIRIGA